MRLTSARASRLAKRPREDTQKSKVYAAGWAALSENIVVGTTQPEVQAYVDRVLDLAWFRRRWGQKRITVVLKRGQGGHAERWSGNIVIGQNATGIMGSAPGASKATVLHEIAHQLAKPRDNNWHGPEFTRVLLELVSFEFGTETAAKLRAEYKAKRVKVGSPTKLLAEAKVPPPRPTPKTWRVAIQTPSGEVVALIQANSLKGALYSLQNTHGPHLAEATDVRIYKSRAVSTRAAAKPARKGR